jgi:hypothetical protein
VDNKLSPLDYDLDHFYVLFKIVGGSESETFSRWVLGRVHILGSQVLTHGGRVPTLEAQEFIECDSYPFKLNLGYFMQKTCQVWCLRVGFSLLFARPNSQHKS